MGLDTDAYMRDSKPTNPTEPRTQWDEETDKIIDEDVFNWHRRGNIHGFFHTLFIEKGGVYGDARIPFCSPDAVEITFEDLEKYEYAIQNMLLPRNISMMKLPIPLGESDMDMLWNGDAEDRHNLLRHIYKDFGQMGEDLYFSDEARKVLAEGKYLYVSSSW